MQFQRNDKKSSARPAKDLQPIKTHPQRHCRALDRGNHPRVCGEKLSTLMQKAMNDQPIQPGEGVLRHAEGVDLIPANIELAGLEVALVNSMNREKMLKQVLDSAKREYDYILLDCIHIINYAKTRPVYDAYRKSGYPRSTAPFHLFVCKPHNTQRLLLHHESSNLLLTLTPKRNRIFRRMCRLTSSKASRRGRSLH